MADERIREDLKREDLAEVESLLASLAPRASRVDRDRLMFLAGQTSVRATQTDVRASAWVAQRAAPRRWVWPAATIVSTTVAVVLACLLALRPHVDAAPQVVYRVEYVERAADKNERPTDGHDAPDRVEKPTGVAASDREPAAEPHWLDDQTGFGRAAFGRNEFRSRFPALALNVDALPMPRSRGSAVPSEPATYRAMLQDLLDEQQPAVPETDDADSGSRFFDWSFFTPRGESS